MVINKDKVEKDIKNINMKRWFYKMKRDCQNRECSFYFDSKKNQPKEMFGANLVRVEELDNTIYFSNIDCDKWGE